MKPRPERGLAEASERLMRMDDGAWARHANPWSFFTRVPILPLLALAVWSRVWIGPACLLPIALLLLWTWLNPRVFPPPADLGAWTSRAVLGERLWLNRRSVPVPQKHRRDGLLLAVLALPGCLLLAWGLFALRPLPTLAGLALAVGGKLWFVARMAALWDAVQASDKRAFRH